jgi:hypothetical protein
MKLGVFAASALVGVVSLASASFAQGDGNAGAQLSRVPQLGTEGSASRIAPAGPPPVLEPSRPAAGMLPQPSGPVRDSSGAPSAAPEQGVNLRSSFRAQ